MTIENTLAFIMAGGLGSRLKILTRDRSKSSVGILGRYRIFDFVATNVANSGIPRVIVATQSQPRSLNNHIGVGEPWGFNDRNKNIEISQPYVSLSGLVTLDGTADAVRKNINRINSRYPTTETVMVLGGDHVYVADYKDVINFHKKKESDLTIMTTLIPDEKASDFGIIRINDNGRIMEFAEKPKDEETLRKFRLTPETKEQIGIKDSNLNYLASMGNYVFDWKKLNCYLESFEGNDFGYDIIPAIKESGGDIHAYVFEGYWRDVGKIKDYFETNMEAVKNETVDLIAGQVSTSERNLPGVRIGLNVSIDGFIGSPGVYIGSGSKIKDVVTGFQVHIGENCDVSKVVLLGANRNQYSNNGKLLREYKTVIGDNSKLENIIVDKNVFIGKNVYLSPEFGTPEERTANLEKIGLKPYLDDNPETFSNSDFYMDNETNILVLGKQQEPFDRPLIPDGFRG
ncbi:MAG: sugar phosphate nucleotidyltransferase [Nanoarchaeota archaeon]|nr:hypothetical protein [Nanoarchaeota archaeon]MBU1030921.1 hypothetical protein [Nanoarchaeota archaeon]MBU1850261.1 hypothetical protein [Nanoarchaeota archaeon]